MRALRIVLWVAAATLAGVTGGHLLVGSLEEAKRPAPQSADDIARELITGEFDLVDHAGRRVTNDDFRGRWRLIFFGYTHCPDVCPTTLGTVARVLDALGADAAAVQPLFVTIDPARDTPPVMAEYAAAFHPDIVGLTGSPEAVAAAARSYRVYYARAPLDGGEEGGAEPEYAMDHTAYLYLMDPDGRYARVFAPTDAAEDIAGTIRTLMDR